MKTKNASQRNFFHIFRRTVAAERRGETRSKGKLIEIDALHVHLN